MLYFQRVLYGKCYSTVICLMFTYTDAVHFFCSRQYSVSKTITDIIQLTETMQSLKTPGDSMEGSGKESIVDIVNVMPPVSPVITVSSRHNSSRVRLLVCLLAHHF